MNDFSDAYIFVRGDIHQVPFKNCVLFTKCIKEIDGITIGDAEDLDFVISMYNMMNIFQIILKQQEVNGFILKMKQPILTMILKIIIILKFSIKRLN